MTGILNPIHGIKEYFADETPMTKGEHRIRTIPAVIVTFVAIILIVARLNTLSSQQAENVQAYAEGVAYTQCVTRVATRDALREVLLEITALFPDGNDAIAVTELINSKYPPLDLAETCPLPGMTIHD